MRKLLFISALLLMATLALSPLAPGHLQAQDGPTEDEIIARLEALDEIEPDDFVSESNREESTSMTLTVQGMTVTQTETATAVINQRGIRTGPDTYNRHAEAEVAFELTDFNGESVAFTMEAAAIMIDNTLYLRGEYTESSGEVPALPDGWLEVSEEELEEWEAFSVLSLEDWFADEDEEDDDDDLAQFLEMAEAGDATYSLEATTLEDGTEADLITILFAPESITDALFSVMDEEDMEDEDAALGMAMFEYLNTDSELVARVWVNENNEMLANEFGFVVVTDAFDMHDIDPDQFPEGTILDAFEQVEYDYERVLSFNTGQKPIEAPDM
jgi:hypothetical protein